MAGFLQRGLLLYLFLAIAISLSAPEVVFTGGSPAGNTVLSWFDMSYNETSGEVITAPNFNIAEIGNATDSLNSHTSTSSGGGILGWLDPLFQVFSWIPLMFKVLFSPILLLTAVDMPGIVILIFAIPLVLLFILGLIGWIRSGIQ